MPRYRPFSPTGGGWSGQSADACLLQYGTGYFPRSAKLEQRMMYASAPTWYFGA
ncbi:MAG TPA: hypothetical protein ACQGQH_02950 [Xylella sp.]